MRKVKSIFEATVVNQPSYVITFEDGFAYIQRRQIIRGTESPLSLIEEVIIALCDSAQGKTAEVPK